MSKNTLGIVIPTIGAGPFLREAVDSALRQSEPFDEIVVLGNGVSQHDLRNCLGPSCHDVRLVNTEERLPPHLSWNTGLSHVSTDFAMVLGDDDVLLPNAAPVARQLAGLCDFGTLGFEFMNAAGLGCGGCVPAFAQSSPREFYERLYLEGLTLMLPGTVFRRKLFFDVGGFACTPFRSGWFIDTDCWMRMVAACGTARHGHDIAWRYRINTGQLGFAAEPSAFLSELDAYLDSHEQMVRGLGCDEIRAFGGDRAAYRERVLIGRVGSSLKNRLLNHGALTFADQLSVARASGISALGRLRLLGRLAAWEKQFRDTRFQFTDPII
jgi:hypothetical protein